MNIFNSSDISNLIGVYPLRGKEYIRYADAFIALAGSESEDSIFEYPYKDFFYKQQLEELGTETKI